jgi:hypothetical protein
MSILDKILDHIGKLFGKGKPTLASLTIDDLNRELTSVEKKWNDLLEESEKISGDEEQLKEEYKAAHTAGKLSQKRTIAQKLKSLELRRKSNDTRLAGLAKTRDVATGLLTIKEIVANNEDSPLGQLIAQLDRDELERYVLDATVEGTLQQDKLAAILQTTIGGVDALVQASGSPGIDEEMDNLDAELGLTSPTTEMPGITAGEVDAMHESLDAVAAKGLDTARKLRQASQRNEHEGTV